MQVSSRWYGIWRVLTRSVGFTGSRHAQVPGSSGSRLSPPDAELGERYAGVVPPVVHLGNVRQLAGQAPLLPGGRVPASVDMDSMQKRVYGPASHATAAATSPCTCPTAGITRPAWMSQFEAACGPPAAAA